MPPGPSAFPLLPSRTDDAPDFWAAIAADLLLVASTGKILSFVVVVEGSTVYRGWGGCASVEGLCDGLCLVLWVEGGLETLYFTHTHTHPHTPASSQLTHPPLRNSSRTAKDIIFTNSYLNTP